MVAEVRSGIQTIDHIAIPVRDLDLNQDFYVNVLGLKFKTTRRNPDGSPRQTYVLAGDNIIGLHLPGVNAGASSSSGPRIGVGVSQERFTETQQKLKDTKHPFTGPVEHSEDSPFSSSIYFDDPDGNLLNILMMSPMDTNPIRHAIVKAPTEI